MHDTKEIEHLFKQLSVCEMFEECCWLYFFLTQFIEDGRDDISLTSHTFDAVLQNHEVLDSIRNRS